MALHLQGYICSLLLQTHVEPDDRQTGFGWDFIQRPVLIVDQLMSYGCNLLSLS